ncbi:hypothetical protein GCM10010435_76770 [Winogradskya consettensis]|uniref:Uncharacterized protein n=1 Tax=Winogradskya consettensis TaxID=113560 RepID=A0A919SNA8_9ACTN|nr:hypothetical protein [Actinoplanes consettensis]GIM74567.1 hypothetical protein Aco04nite_40980 [Actinoplanes consettensis]
MTTSRISLTGPDSHTLVRQPGVGIVIIGPALPGSRRPDLVVSAADTIDWSVFDPFTVPAGYPWPRVFRYEGDDTGFLTWAARRPIETFTWQPHAPLTADASAAQLSRLSVILRNGPLTIVLPADCHYFSAAGDLSLLTVTTPGDCPPLGFFPDTQPSGPPVALPPLPGLAYARSVDVTVPPLRQPFDCASLLQFPGLTRVALSGSLTNLSALASLRHLEMLELRYCPDLSDLPPLDTWTLSHLLLFNADDTTGKRLRASGVPSLSISQPRKPPWFRTEYGLPFSAWTPRKAKAATKAYRSAASAIGKATTAADAEEAVRAFVRVINALPDVETTEREDAGEAVALLTTGTPYAQAAEAWFDAERDF